MSGFISTALLNGVKWNLEKRKTVSPFGLTCACICECVEFTRDSLSSEHMLLNACVVPVKPRKKALQSRAQSGVKPDICQCCGGHRWCGGTSASPQRPV